MTQSLLSHKQRVLFLTCKLSRSLSNLPKTFRKRLYAGTGTVPVNNKYLTGTVPANEEHLTGTVPVNKDHLTSTLSIF